MQVTIGKEGLTKTWQADFLETTECTHCQGEARIAFVAYEGLDSDVLPQEVVGQLVCNLHPNDPKGSGYWVHDSCAVAVYFCKKCLLPTATMNQG